MNRTLRKLRVFLHRSTRLAKKNAKPILTIVAGVIVFTTYAVKEVWREHIRNEVENIDVAINELHLQISMQDLSFQVIEGRLNNVTSPRSPRSEQVREEREKLKFQLLMGGFSKTEHDSDAFLSSLPLVEKRSRKRREEIEQKIREQFSTWETILHQSLPAARENEAFNALGRVYVLIGERQTLFLETAEEIKREKESSDVKLSIASFLLFGVGLVVGAIGQLKGVEDLPGTD